MSENKLSELELNSDKNTDSLVLKVDAKESSGEKSEFSWTRLIIGGCAAVLSVFAEFQDTKSLEDIFPKRENQEVAYASNHREHLDLSLLEEIKQEYHNPELVHSLDQTDSQDTCPVERKDAEFFLSSAQEDRLDVDKTIPEREKSEAPLPPITADDLRDLAQGVADALDPENKQKISLKNLEEYDDPEKKNSIL